MSRPKPIFVDTSVISSNIFNYRDDEFYSIIGQLTGLEEAGFLKVHDIRTVNSFLRIENVFNVLTIDAEEINNIKKDICFMLNDDTYIIKPLRSNDTVRIRLEKNNCNVYFNDICIKIIIFIRSKEIF